MSQEVVIKKIIEALEKEETREASILIRFYLNDKSYIWYKNVNNIIQDQITNLFYDVDAGNVKNGLCITFFKRQLKKLEFYSKYSN